VLWGTQVGKAVTEPAVKANSPLLNNDDKVDSPSEATPSRSSVHLIGEVSRTVTPDTDDDPGRFESAKQKKTTLLEGIRKFNFKPKRVRIWETRHFHRPKRADS
jgi:brefeldin A-inhibited guanine nucleotide-exchange protein